MTSSNDSMSDFLDQLAYFGAALTGNPQRIAQEYNDLEVFVLGATLKLSVDTRATQAFLLWVIRYGCLLSPSKLRRLIQAGHPHDPTLLGAMIDLIRV